MKFNTKTAVYISSALLIVILCNIHLRKVDNTLESLGDVHVSDIKIPSIPE